MKHIYSLLFVLLSFFTVSWGQNGVGINETGSSPHSSSILDLASTKAGILIPRMSLTQRNTNISSPATGLLIYQTDNTPGFYYYNGTIWVRISDAGNGVQSISVNAPLTSTGGQNPTLDITQASTSTNGFLSSTDWNTFNNKLTSTLTNGRIWVGNASNTAQERLMSGDVTISNTGVTTISNDAVTSAKILDGTILNIDINASAAIDRTKLANGTANHVLINNGSGVMSSEAQLALSRGGTNAALTAVAGSIVWSNATQFQLSAAGTTGQVLVSGGASAPTWSDAGSLLTAGTGISISGNTVSNTGAVTASNGLTLSGTDVRLGGTLSANTDVAQAGFDFRFTGSGSVGIGTTGAPGVKLDVNGAVRTNNGFIANDGGTGTPSIRFTNDANSGIYRPGASSMGFVIANTEMGRFNSNALNVTRLGVGGGFTYAPNTPLDVVGGSSGIETRLLTVRSNFTANNTASAIALINSTSSSSNVGVELASLTTNSSNGASQMIFRTHGGGGSFGALIERMRLTNEGRLGLGTNSPSDNLHVDNSASGATSARLGALSAQFDNRLFFGDGSNVYVGEQVADNRLYLRGSTVSVDINGSTGGANGRVLTSNGTTVSWQPPVPIGGVIAWVNHLTGTPSLPAGWVECNGGTISDSESPINGQSIPNLNNVPTGTFGTPSGGYYLRGTTGTTGGTQADRSPNLEINQSSTSQGVGSGTVSNDGATQNFSGWLNNYYWDDSFRWRFVGGEVRPVTYTVRWIMRIK